MDLIVDDFMRLVRSIVSVFSCFAIVEVTEIYLEVVHGPSDELCSAIIIVVVPTEAAACATVLRSDDSFLLGAFDITYIPRLFDIQVSID